jgi:hypothetical protein
MRYLKHPVDILTILIILWCFLFVGLNFFVPDKWVLNYQEFYAPDVCRDEVQQIYGKRTALFTMESSGVDRLYSVDLDRYVDRLEWQGQYHAGTTDGEWKHQVTEPEGLYRWESTTLKVQFPLFFSKYIEDVESNDFLVTNCN